MESRTTVIVEREDLPLEEPEEPSAAAKAVVAETVEAPSETRQAPHPLQPERMRRIGQLPTSGYIERPAAPLKEGYEVPLKITPGILSRVRTELRSLRHHPTSRGTKAQRRRMA